MSDIAIPITQADRDFAADCARALGDLNVQHIVDGVEDETAIVQLCAQKRLSLMPQDRATVSFIEAIHERTPNGESIVVQHHPSGDWSVAHEPLLVTNGWQPIEKAPTNTSVLVVIPNAEHYGHGVYRAMLVDMGTGRRWITTGYAIGRDCPVEGHPTHWMSLPQAPAYSA